MKTNFKINALTLALVSAVGGLYTAPAFSQGSVTTLEEIVVTARKVEESLQDIPLSISAFTADQLKKRSIEELEDVALQTPGLAFEDYSNGGFGAPVIRGAAQLSITQLEQNVSVFLDGVYIPRGYALDIGTSNLERIEVVKGPQSALYGANAFVGAINYVSKTADLEEFDASIEGTIGDDERQDISGEVSIPLVADKLAVRLAGGYSEYDGDWVNNHPDANVGISPGTNGNIGGWEKNSYEIGVLAKPSDNLTLSLNYHSYDVDSETRAQFRLHRGDGDTNCSPTLLFGFQPANQLFCGELPSTPIPGASGVEGVVIDPRSFGLDGETDILRANVAWNISEEFTLTYQFANIEAEVFSAGESDRDSITGTALPFPPFTVGNVFSVIPNGGFDYDTHELRLEYTADSGLYAMVGVYDLDGTDSEASAFGLLALGGTDPITSELDVTGGNPVAPLVTTIESTSIFGRISVPLMDDRLVVALEGRYTDEEKPAVNSGLPFTYSDTYFTPRVSVDYKLADDRLLYATVAKGIKSGGVNGSSFAGLIAEERFYAPDENVTYELGTKNTFLDGSLQLNAAIYFMDWSDLQVQNTPTGAPINTPTITTNLGAAETKGIELDLTYIVTEHLTLNLGVTSIDATYDGGTFSGRAIRTALCDDVVCNANGDVSGNDLPRSPDFQWNIGATYSGNLTADLTYFIRGDLVGQGEQFASELNVATIESRQLLNLRAGIDHDDWSAEFWMKNATDEVYVSNVFFIANPFQVDYVPTLGNQRRMGATFKYNF